MYSLNQRDVFPSYDAVFWPACGLRYQLGESSSLLENLILNSNIGYIDRTFRTRGVSLGSELDISLGKQVDPDKVYNLFYFGVEFNYLILNREVDGIKYIPPGSQTITLRSHGSGWSQNFVLGLENRPSRSFGFDLALEFLGTGDVPMKLEDHPSGFDFGDAEHSIAMHGIAFRAGFIYYLPSHVHEDTIWTRPLK